MNSRNMLKALALALVVASSIGTAGCTQRTIIEEPASEESANTPGAESAAEHTEGAIANHPLYVRSGETELGEQESGPFPQPWQSRLGPFPQPWHREGDSDDDGKTPPPPNNDPDPDPNPKP
jgi:hypothetical protein